MILSSTPKHKDKPNMIDYFKLPEASTTINGIETLGIDKTGYVLDGEIVWVGNDVVISANKIALKHSEHFKYLGDTFSESIETYRAIIERNRKAVYFHVYWTYIICALIGVEYNLNDMRQNACDGTGWDKKSFIIN